MPRAQGNGLLFLLSATAASPACGDIGVPAGTGSGTSTSGSVSMEVTSASTGAGSTRPGSTEAGATGADSTGPGATGPGATGPDDTGSDSTSTGSPPATESRGDTTAGAGDDCPDDDPMEADAPSLIWIANSPQGTISKIDTQTGEELARYWSGPSEGNDDPSRISVNLAGDVAVSNRGSGVIKLAGHVESCRDLDGNGAIETSTGPDDVLPFGTDECVLWYQELPGDGDNRHGPRPTAWDTGDAGSCTVDDDRLWVGWYDAPADTGRFRRLDGADGTTLDEVAIPGWNTTSAQENYGPYGGAVNAEGDLWLIGLFGPLARIDAETLDVDVWPCPEGIDPYGITLDAEGNPWTAGWTGTIARFDVATETFEAIPTTNGRRLRGLQADRDGQLWIAANLPCGVVQVDVASRTIVDEDIVLPDCQTPVGVSIDVDGNIWLPDRGADVAFTLDPSNGSTTLTPGLVSPYTYSDMTGAGLRLVVDPPRG